VPLFAKLVHSPEFHVGGALDSTGAAQEQFIFLNPLGRHVPSGDREHASWTHHYRAGRPTRPPTIAPTKGTGITA
jgi:hypothetical protein